MKVAFYGRVSTQEQVEGTSLESQLSEFRRWAGYHNHEVTGEYLDEGKSGTSADGRDGLRQAMGDARAGCFEAVVVTKLDRFFRNLRVLLNYIDELHQGKVKFISIGENLDTSTLMGRFTLQILGVIAEWERERIIERTKSGRYARYQQHKWGPGQPLYGYTYNRDTGKLEIREDEAVVVRRIFHLYVFGRLGFEQIARLLNSEGVKPRQHAVRWHSAAIKDVIKHPGYKGEHPLGIDCPTIIDPPTWDMAQRRRKDNLRLHRRKGSPWLLQGLIKCTLCGHLLACKRFHGRRVYSCYGRIRGTRVNDDSKCTLPNIDAEWLEGQISERIAEALSTPQNIQKAIDDTMAKLSARKSQLEAAIQPVEQKLEQVRGKLAKLAEDWVTKRLDREKVSKLREELEGKEQQLAQVRAEIDPRQLEELERTSQWLSIWQGIDKQHKEGNAPGSWPLAFVRTQPGRQGYKVMDDWGDAEDICGAPTNERALLDYLQAEVWAYRDRVQVKALMPMRDIAQGCDPDYRSAHSPRSR